jgi:integrase
MPKIPYLFRPKGRHTWQFRRRIPDDLGALKKLYGSHYKVSLETTDRKEAERKARIQTVLSDEMFRQAREGRVPPERLRDAARRFASSLLADFQREVDGMAQMNPQDVADQVEDALGTSWIEAEMGRKSSQNPEDPKGLRRSPELTARATREAAVQGIPVTVGTEDFDEFRALIGRASIYVVRKVQERVGAGRPYTDPLFDDPSPVPASTMTLGEAIKRFMTDPNRSTNVKTLGTYNSVFRIVAELLGDAAPVSGVTRDHARSFLADLRAVPANMAQRFPKMSVRQAVEASQGRTPMAPKTLNKYIDFTSALFRFAQQEGWTDRNPFEGLRVKDPVDPKDKRLPFSPGHLAAIRDSLTSLPADHAMLLRVLAWTGCRLAEALGLRREDLKTAEGVTYLDVLTHEDRGLKNTNSRRVIPVHRGLADAGLVEWVARRSEGYLWPDLIDKKPGEFGKNASKRFNRWLGRIGVKKDRKLALHSFRHSMEDALLEAGVPEDIRNRLTGHTNKGVGSRVYGSREVFGVLDRAMQKVAIW